MAGSGLSIHSVMESILPNTNDRRLVLGRFVHSAQLATTIAPDSLAATLWPNGFRLNVGQVETFTFLDDRLRIMLAANNSDRGLSGLSVSPSTYASIRNPNCAFTGDVTEYRKVKDRVDPLHELYIHQAATTANGRARRGSPFPKTDLANLIAYAEAFLGSKAQDPEKPTSIHFNIGSEYTRNYVFAALGIPRHSGGPWYTGCTSHGPDWFIFCKIGISGRTEHDYENYFIGDDMIWSAKNNTHLHQPNIQQLLSSSGRVYVFYREGQRDPFTFAGAARPVKIFDTTPVKVRWRFHPIDGQRQDYALPEELDDDDLKTLEGERRSVFVNIYERNPSARRKCLSHWKPICQICEFDFGATYGPLGDGFIHVHHIKPLGEIGEAYLLDPIRDLIPICPNCHAMVHQQKPALAVDALKAIIRERRQRN